MCDLPITAGAVRFTMVDAGAPASSTRTLTLHTYTHTHVHTNTHTLSHIFYSQHSVLRHGPHTVSAQALIQHNQYKASSIIRNTNTVLANRRVALNFRCSIRPFL